MQILFNFWHSISTSSTTHKSMFSKTLKLAKKNDTQPKQGGEEILPHIPPKPNLKQQELEKLPHVQIWTNCQIIFMSTPYTTYM